MSFSLHELKIRPYAEHDFQSCCDIFMSNTPKFFLNEELKDYQGYLQKHALGHYWVMVGANDDIAAVGGVYIKEDKTASLCYGMVRANLHKKGLGSLMISYRLLKALEDKSVERIRLDTVQHNPAFFAKFGFKTTKVTDNFYGPGLHRYDMELLVPDNAAELQLLKDRLSA